MPRLPRLAMGLLSKPSAAPPTGFTHSLYRRDDFLVLNFTFINLVVVSAPAGGGQVLALPFNAPPGAESFVIVEFPHQSVLEEAFLDPTFDPSPPPPPLQPKPFTPKPPPVGSRLSGKSRLAFTIPPTVLPIPYTVEGLLDWHDWKQRVVPVATGDVPANTTIRPPSDTETAIEVPWWLVLSPNKSAIWLHSDSIQDVTHQHPVTKRNWTELWHARLADLHDPGPPVRPTIIETPTAVRAVWLRDYDNQTSLTLHETPSTDSPFPSPSVTALTAKDRYDIVRNTSDFSRYPTYKPQPIDVDRLMLTSLGAWIDSDGHWESVAIPGQQSPFPSDVIEWRQRSTMGRDHYVRIVREGYLFPFGHKAVLTKITERKFDPENGGNVAYLHQRYFIVVRQPDVEYPAFGQPFDARRFPFRQVRCTTTVTPDLDKPLAYVPGTGDQDDFVPSLVNGTQGGTPPPDAFLFHMVGTDWAGEEVDFTTPVVFVSGDVAYNPNPGSTLDKVITQFNAGDIWAPLWTRDLQGQNVALAEPVKVGDTTQQLVAITWGADNPGGGVDFATADQLAAHPKASFTLRLAPAEQASGGTIDQPQMSYLDSYVTGGFGAGQVYLEQPQKTAAKMTFAGHGDRSGGLAAPDVGITGLSRSHGVVGGTVATAAAGTFDPADFFNGVEATILGGIDLVAILGLAGQPLGNAPALTYSTEGDVVTTALHWLPAVAKDPLGIFDPVPDGKLTIDAAIETHLTAPDQSTYKVVGDLEDFQVHLFGDGAFEVLDFAFNKVVFTAAKGTKTKVDADIAHVDFVGILDFVQQLASVLSGNDGPSIDVTPTQVTATIGLPIPSISVGVFSLENISLNLGVALPFTGDPARVRFSFCTRENPFILTVCMFGGGGFFGVALGVDGLELVEASLEFGAAVAIDIGVASGEVHIMAGIYFKVEQKPDGDKTVDATTLTGYVRAGGSLEVLGLVQVSMEFYLGLTYLSPENKVTGQATLTMEVDLGLFSKSITATMEKHFGNDAADPSFGDLMSSDDWSEYCLAFAGADTNGE